MKKPFKLLIAVPCMDYLHAEFVKSLQKLTTHLCREGVNFTVEIHSGSLVYFARNRMANKAVDEGYTHLLFLDSDMVFDENIVETLEFSGKGFRSLYICTKFPVSRASITVPQPILSRRSRSMPSTRRAIRVMHKP